MTKQPSYRFAGYTEVWEEKKLGEVSTSFSGGTPAAGNKKYYGGEIPFIRSAEINSDTTELFLTKEGLDNSSAKLVKEGDILYALYGATSGEVGISKINGAINQAILSIIPKNNYTSEFIMQWLRLQKKNITDKYLQGGQGNLSGSIVKELAIFFPSLPEQTAIGSFFQDIDQLISLQQRKLEVLKEQKKTYLKLLFPAKGQTKPALRFAGFEDEWKEVKLGEVTERITRKNKHLESTLPLTISAQYGLIDQETFFNKKVASKDVSGYYLLKRGEFAYNKSYSSEYPWGAVKRLDNYEKGILSPLYIVFKPKFIDSDFLAVYYASSNWHKEVSMRASEGARNHGLLNISPQDFFDTELIVPISSAEQEAIGSFFQDLDKAIAKQEEKVNQLKESKQTLLRKMFI